MKSKILLLAIGLVTILSFGANAVNKEAMKKDNFNGWFCDKDNSYKWNYYENGEMVVNNWFTSTNGKKYYFREDGSMATGWNKLNSNWYYFDSEGIMHTGWWSDRATNKWYYLNSDGTMAHDTTIDGYQLGSDGAWIQ